MGTDLLTVCLEGSPLDVLKVTSLCAVVFTFTLDSPLEVDGTLGSVHKGEICGDDTVVDDTRVKSELGNSDDFVESNGFGICDDTAEDVVTGAD